MVLTMEIGAQLYTLREYAKTPEALAETLRRVADIGYRTVQVSGTCSYEADWLRERLLETGLRCVLTHYSPDRIREAPEDTAAFHRIFGCYYIGIGSAPGGLATEEDYRRFVRDFKEPGRRLRRAGCQMMYHNHAMEFARGTDGRLYIERMAADFQPEELMFTLDTYWVQYGGGDPAAWLERLSGRVPCVHLKDMAYTDRPVMAPVGTGNMNFEAILKACDKAGARWLLVEQDDCYGEDAFDCLRRSYKYLKAQGLS